MVTSKVPPSDPGFGTLGTVTPGPLVTDPPAGLPVIEKCRTCESDYNIRQVRRWLWHFGDWLKRFQRVTGVQVYTFIFLQLIFVKILLIGIGSMRWCQRGRERVEAKCWIQAFWCVVTPVGSNEQKFTQYHEIINKSTYCNKCVEKRTKVYDSMLCSRNSQVFGVTQYRLRLI